MSEMVIKHTQQLKHVFKKTIFICGAYYTGNTIR